MTNFKFEIDKNSDWRKAERKLEAVRKKNGDHFKKMVDKQRIDFMALMLNHYNNCPYHPFNNLSEDQKTKLLNAHAVSFSEAIIKTETKLINKFSRENNRLKTK